MANGKFTILKVTLPMFFQTSAVYFSPLAELFLCPKLTNLDAILLPLLSESQKSALGCIIEGTGSTVTLRPTRGSRGTNKLSQLLSSLLLFLLTMPNCPTRKTKSSKKIPIISCFLPPPSPLPRTFRWAAVTQALRSHIDWIIFLTGSER